MQIIKTKRPSTRLRSTVFLSLSFALAALVAALAGAGSNLDLGPFRAELAKTSSTRVAPSFGQANGGLTANLPNPHDLRRRLRERVLTGVNIIETSHHQSRAAL